MLQACLYLAIDMAGYDGFRCPEFIGKKFQGVTDFVDAVAIFNKGAISKMKGYSFWKVMNAIQYSSQHGNGSTHSTVIALRDQLAFHAAELHRGKVEKMLKQQQQDAEAKKQEANRKYLVDDGYVKDAYKAYFSVMRPFDTDGKFMRKIRTTMDKHMGEYISKSPEALVAYANEIMQNEIA